MATASHPPKDPLVAIIGATGTGKSKLAVELATRFNGEIINGDVMQMYKGLPIITNKIPDDERNSIPHHLLGTVSLASEPWTVSRFVHESQNIIREIRSRGRLPILVGGSHYYTQALLLRESLVVQTQRDVPSSDEETQSDNRAQWPILSATTPEIYARLQEVDPVIAKRWHPKDRRKLQRSLEIWLQTGRKASDVYEEQHQQRTARPQRSVSSDTVQDGWTNVAENPGGMRYSTLIFWLETQDDVLLERLSLRVGNMVDNGMIEEAQSLEQLARNQEAEGSPPNTSKGIWISIGYKEFKPYLDALHSDVASEAAIESLRTRCIEATIVATRQYTRQQRKWIRNRLLNAFDEAGTAKQLFVLDSSDLDQWGSAVTEPSQEVTEMFLNGQPLSDPLKLSDFAYKHLTRTSANGLRHQNFLARRCEVCNKTLVTDLEWEGHLASRRHKKALEGQSKRERGEARRQGLISSLETNATELIERG